MLRSIAILLSLLSVVAARRRLAGHEGGHAHGGDEECSCAQHEPDHPFTIDCSDVATINAATLTLETECSAATAYEWGGAFATPASAYKWVSQAVGAKGSHSARTRHCTHVHPHSSHCDA